VASASTSLFMMSSLGDRKQIAAICFVTHVRASSDFS
jgi:putative Ca2+/H+ antiporter (TMEM165/GDT1 family)